MIPCLIKFMTLKNSCWLFSAGTIFRGSFLGFEWFHPSALLLSGKFKDASSCLSRAINCKANVKSLRKGLYKMQMQGIRKQNCTISSDK